MSKKLSSINEFLLGTEIFGILGAVILSFSRKGDILLYLNTHLAPYADNFFKIYTHLGLGALLAIFAVIFLFIRYYYSILFIATLISAGIIVFISKGFYSVSCAGLPKILI